MSEKTRRRRALELKQREKLRQELEADYGVPHLHPKAERLFELAWEYGHAFGFTEVGTFYGDFVDLIDRPEEGERDD